MLNLRQQQQAFVKFDKNLYNFEKKRQIVDNKVKEKEKELIETEKNKKQNTSQNKKIKINFNNSFVNQQTHEKYDKIIENNIKKNNEKLERIIEKEMKKVENVVTLINKVETNMINMEKMTKNKNNSDDYLEDKECTNLESGNTNQILIEKAEEDNQITNTTNMNLTKMNNTTNNESEMILIESVSYFKSKLSDNSKLNETVTEKAEKTNYHKFYLFPIIDETLKYESEEEKDENISEKEKENLIEMGNSQKKEYCKIEENINEENINIIEQVEDNHNDKKYSNYNNNKVFEETYDVFLQDSIDFNGSDKKNSLQQTLRNQMKNIASNIKDRKKDKDNLKGEKKKNLLDYLYNDKDEGKIQNLESNKIPASIDKLYTITSNENKEINITNSDSKCTGGFKQNNNYIPELFTFGKEKNISDNKLITNEKKENLTPEEEKLPFIINNEIEKDYTDDFINDEIQNNNEDALDEEEVTTIHQSIKIENSKEVDNNVNLFQNFDLNEFIKENTRDDIFDADDIINYGHENEINTEYDRVIPNEYINGNKLHANEKDKYIEPNIKNQDQEQDLMFQEIEPIEDDHQEQIKSFSKNRVLVFENCEDPSQLEAKNKKLEKIREQKLKDIEQRREKSKSKSKIKNTNSQALVDNKEKVKNESKEKIPNNIKKRAKSPIGNKNNKLPNNPEAIMKRNSNIPLNDNSNVAYNSNANNDNSSSRVPIKIVREEAQLANKKLKNNVNFTKLSNKKTIKSAIGNVCLAGEPNRVCREKILEIIEKCPCENFIILFKGNFGRYDLRAIYTFNSQSNRTELLSCLTNSPIVLEPHMISNYFKYDNTQKDFKLLGEAKEISVIVDAVSLVSHK